MDSLLTTILVSPISKLCIDLDSQREGSLVLKIVNMTDSRSKFPYKEVLCVMKRSSPTTILAA
jgi:hypothetical protein